MTTGTITITKAAVHIQNLPALSVFFKYSFTAASYPMSGVMTTAKIIALTMLIERA